MAREKPRKHLYVVALVGILFLLATTHLYLQGPTEGADSAGCKKIYMYPSFARIKSFDETHTKYASKYSLYLYREQGKDAIPAQEGEGFTALDGIPALFIPGNAGSYRQVRSIAAECSNLYFDDNINIVENPNTRNYDFFAADFNEDFTAFHGRTLLDQAEYLNEAVRFILLLYAHNASPPTSVLILAHSMGGVVSRVMPTLANYVPGSINTMVTLASPHSAAPLTFDGDILKVYLAADRFWYEAFNSPDVKGLPYSRLHNISLISITGGLLDSILPADYTSLGFLIPPTNGFTVYTTGIPDVWTPMDHLAIVWCRQFRRSVLRALMEIADFNSPHRTYPLEKRMAIMRHVFLSGFEEYAKQDSPLRLGTAKSISADRAVKLKFDLLKVITQSGPSAVWKSHDHFNTEQSFALFPLTEDSTVLILSDRPLDALREKGSSDSFLSVLLCQKEGESAFQQDFTSSSTKEFLELVCLDLLPSMNPVPRSSKDVSTLVESAFDGDKTPFNALYLDPQDLKGYENLVVVGKRLLAEAGFTIVQLSDQKSSEHIAGSDLFTLIRRGVDVSLLPNLAVNINIPGAWSSILAYKLRIKESSGNLFEPFIRQWRDDPYETKWHINLRGEKQILLSMHGIAPYTPFNTKKESHGLNLQIWADPQQSWSEENVTAVDLVLSVDWTASLKLLVLRYRLAVVSHCLAISVLVMMFQIIKYSQTGIFPDYLCSLSRLTDMDIMAFFAVALSLLTPLVKMRSVQVMLDVMDPVVLQDANEMNLSLHNDFDLNSFYLGLQESCLFPVGFLFYVMAVGTNFLLYHALTYAGSFVVILARQLSKVLRFKSRPPPEAKDTVVSSGVRRKFVGLALVLMLVPFHLPYQFAFVISFAVQVLTCIKILWNKGSVSQWSYHVSFLIMMLWVLPINIPVLVVFVHNLNVSWVTPFSSHHNFLAVAPILMLAELHSFYDDIIPLAGLVRGEGPQKAGNSWYRIVSVGLLGYTVGYSIIYGARHTYWLHHLFNIWCCWVLLVFFSNSSGRKLDKHH